MNNDTITKWLERPDALPNANDVDAMVKSWPWFVPARHMQAALLHDRQPFSKDVHAMLSLYGSNWATGYSHLTAKERPIEQVQPLALVSEPEQEFTNVTEAATSVVPEPATIEVSQDLQEEEKTPATEQKNIPIEEEPVETPLIQPLYTEDYFRHQGIETEAPLPEPEHKAETGQDPKSLMVMMSFGEWLTHFKVKSDKERAEEQDKRALRSMWQREKLAAALDEEPEEIPEDVFEMAVTSITREDDLASESLAEILEKQEKWDAAAEMYRKLGLRNPSKSAYFALRAEAAKKKKI